MAPGTYTGLGIMNTEKEENVMYEYNECVVVWLGGTRISMVNTAVVGSGLADIRHGCLEKL